jgi:hypothetical protein
MKEKLENIKLMKLTILYGVIAGCSILLSFITGIGIASYDKNYGFGIKSFFEGQNDISLVLLLCLIFSFYFIIHNKDFKYLFYALIITAGAFLLGTRAGMAISVLLWILIAFSLLFFRFRSSHINLKNRIVFILSILLVVGASFIEIVNVLSRFEGTMRKFNIDVIIKGADFTRGGLVKSGKTIVSEGNIKEIYFGHGNYGFGHKNYLNLLRMPYGGDLVSYGDEQGYRTIESDFIETYGSYGFLLGTCILIVPVIFTLMALNNLLRKLSLQNFLFLIGLLMFLCNAYYAGHAIGSISIASPLAVYFYCVYIENGVINNRKRLKL